MGNKTKRIISIVAAALLAGSAFALTACKDKPYSLDNALTMPAAGEAVSNGGFAVEKGEYVYFINGQALSTADNTYGSVQKGSLMRIKKSDLSDPAKCGNAETVVPLLVVGGDMSAGIYIHGDYVYFATPRTDKDLNNNVKAGLDFKRAKLDGTEVMSDAYFQTTSTTVQFRFVTAKNGKVYCMYVDGGALKSYCVDDRKETVLVKGAESSFIFDETDKDSDVVYYTMKVPASFFGTDDEAKSDYSQIYRVTATATATVDASKASYTVTGDGYTATYDFNEAYYQEKIDEAKEAQKKDKDVKIPYDLSDYTTYSYVNLGELVVDGIGSNKESAPDADIQQFHNMDDYTAAKKDSAFAELTGYTYTLQSYENGGIYFTRANVNATENDPKYLYYVANDAISADGWNSVLCNEKDTFTVVSNDTAKASASAIFYIENGVHKYLYVSGDTLMRATQPSAAVAEVPLAQKGFTGRTLLYVKDNYLYSYSTDTKGLYRIDCMGDESKYHNFAGDEEYADVRVLEIEFNTAWYEPEFFGGVLLYNDAQTINGTAYNYINAVNLAGTDANGMMKTSELTAFNEKYAEVTDFIEGLKGDKKLSAAVMSYFRSGSRAAVDAIVAEYGDKALSENDLVEFNAYVNLGVGRKPSTTAQQANNYAEKFVEDGVHYNVASYFVNTVGKVSDEDAEAMKEGFKATVYTKPVVEGEEAAKAGLKWWHWTLIAVGGAIVVVGGVFLFLYLRKQSKKAMEERMRASKPRRKIDTTDDKTIDVYADEESEEAKAEETVEAPAEEAPVEEAVAVEETVEETVETPVEEAPVEEAPAEEKTEE